MSEWTPQRVLDAAAATEFLPEGAIEVRTNDYRLLRHPDWVLGPSLGVAQVGGDVAIGPALDEKQLQHLDANVFALLTPLIDQHRQTSAHGVRFDARQRAHRQEPPAQRLPLTASAGWE